MKDTFLWHDYETFSLKARFTRPSQFAAIRTDKNLNQIEDPILMYCKPARDFLPDPSSCLITGITPEFCFKNGILEYLFANKIKMHMSVPNTTNIGYNNIFFDDEVTRFMMWRNLIDPYGHIWENNCSRWDLLNLVVATYVLRPLGIIWPKNIHGLPTFKLGKLVKSNGLINVKLHDALSDVRSTIFLAKLIKNKYPKFFNFFFSIRKKKCLLLEMGSLSKKPFIYISRFFSKKNNNLYILLFLSVNPFNKNQIITWNLKYNICDFIKLNINSIKNFFINKINSLLVKNNINSPLKIIYLNKSPIVINDFRILTYKNFFSLGINFNKILQNYYNLSKLSIPSDLWNSICYKYSINNSLDIEYNLYSNNISLKDKILLSKIKLLNSSELSNKKFFFENNCLYKMLFHYKARNFPQSLSLKEKNLWKHYLCSVLFKGKNKSITLNEFFTKIHFLNKNINSNDKKILKSLYKYAKIINPKNIIF